MAQPVRRGLGAFVAAALLAGPAVAGTASAGAASPSLRSASASVRVSGVRADGSTVRVQGSVTLSRDTPAVRRLTRVELKLSEAGKKSEQRTVGITAKRTFATAWRTALTGRITVTARALLSGRPSGRAVIRTITITPAAPAPTTPVAPVTTTGKGTPLTGTFKLAAGSAPAGAAPTGSYFEMLSPNGKPLENLSSPAANNDYTPLTPGSDGGLTTTGYQAAPSPAFSGGGVGAALADKIIEPVPFYDINFSVDTNPTDAQTGTADPVPAVSDDGGVLSGQVIAWDAQWNGQSFNQGAPKPGNTLPGTTTPLTGSYDATTGAYTLEWKSLIVGGPFNTFTGVWHLAGTFVPAATSITGIGTVLPPL